MKNEVTQNCYEKALEVLKKCSTSHGLLASGRCGDYSPDGAPHTTGYPQIWARDSMISLLGCVLSGDKELILAAKSSIKTLIKGQSHLGKIPLNVDYQTNKVTKENSGSVDANTWFIIGVYWYWLLTGDNEFLKEIMPALRKAHLWLQYQDSNECGLLEVHECANWADLYPTSYNTLYDNVLWYFSNLVMSRMAKDRDEKDAFLKRAKDIKEKINFLFWVDRGWDAEYHKEGLERAYKFHLEWFNTYEITNTSIELPFYISHVMFRDFGRRFDSFGNFLALTLDISTESRSDKILNYVEGAGINTPYPVKIFYPAIYPGDRDWRDYMYSRNLNLPHHYHNGGIWGVVGGWYVIALIKNENLNEAKLQLGKLAESLLLEQKFKGERCNFNEYHHGQTGKPMGNTDMCMHAGMYVATYKIIQNPGYIKQLFI